MAISKTPQFDSARDVTLQSEPRKEIFVLNSYNFMISFDTVVLISYKSNVFSVKACDFDRAHAARGHSWFCE